MRLRYIKIFICISSIAPFLSVNVAQWYSIRLETRRLLDRSLPELFSGPTPSNAPCNDVAPLKTIMYRAIKTTGTLIVIVDVAGICYQCCGAEIISFGSGLDSGSS